VPRHARSTTCHVKTDATQRFTIDIVMDSFSQQANADEVGKLLHRLNDLALAGVAANLLGIDKREADDVDIKFLDLLKRHKANLESLQ
jgi:hypothetical protein